MIRGGLVEARKEAGRGVGEGVGHSATVESEMERRRVWVRQEASRDGGSGKFGQVCEVREGAVWMRKLQI